MQPYLTNRTVVLTSALGLAGVVIAVQRTQIARLKRIRKTLVDSHNEIIDLIEDAHVKYSAEAMHKLVTELAFHKQMRPLQ